MKKMKRKNHLRYIGALLMVAVLLCGCATQETADPELLDPVVLEPETAVVGYEDLFNLTAAGYNLLPRSN